MEGSRARFIEAVVHCDKVTRAMDITTIRADAAADDALCGQLRTLAQLLVSKADMLGRGA
jgi:hypothetical protein